MARVRALKNFPFAQNGINVVQMSVGDEVEISDLDTVETLIKHGYFEEVKTVASQKSSGEAPKNKMEKGSPKDKRKRDEDDSDE